MGRPLFKLFCGLMILTAVTTFTLVYITSFRPSLIPRAKPEALESFLTPKWDLLEENIHGGSSFDGHDIPRLLEFSNETAFAFVHLRKCGGTSVRRWIWDSIFPFGDPSLTETTWALTPCNRQPCDVTSMTKIHAIMGVPRANQAVAIVGHLPLPQVREFLQRNSSNRTLYCLTQSRDVYERVVSCLYFRTPEGTLDGIDKWNETKFESFLRDFRDSSGQGCLNEIARMFSSEKDENILSTLQLQSKQGRSILQESKANIAQCAVLRIESPFTNRMIVHHYFPMLVFRDSDDIPWKFRQIGRARRLNTTKIDRFRPVVERLNAVDIMLHNFMIDRHITQSEISSEHILHGSRVIPRGAILDATQCPAIEISLNSSMTVPACDRAINGMCGPFLCNNGFALVGAAYIICRKGGLWSNPPPVCERVESRSNPKPHVVIYFRFAPDLSVLTPLTRELEAICWTGLDQDAHIEVVITTKRMADLAKPVAELQMKFGGSLNIHLRDGEAGTQFQFAWQLLSNRTPGSSRSFVLLMTSDAFEVNFVQTVHRYREIFQIFDRHEDVGIVAPLIHEDGYVYDLPIWMRGSIATLCLALPDVSYEIESGTTEDDRLFHLAKCSLVSHCTLWSTRFGVTFQRRGHLYDSSDVEAGGMLFSALVT